MAHVRVTQRNAHAPNAVLRYDYTHCIVDSLENITHSLCTLEFARRQVRSGLTRGGAVVVVVA
jgi:glutamyl/glutaminyl-tRNA synthetase